MAASDMKAVLDMKAGPGRRGNLAGVGGAAARVYADAAPDKKSVVE
jgi:hypothetical protein